MRYRLYFIRQHSWATEIAPAHRFYYTDEPPDLHEIFGSKGKTTAYILKLNHSPERDPKFKNVFPIDGYDQTYIVNIGDETFSFLLVGEGSKLFNYYLIGSSSDIVNMLSGGNLLANYNNSSVNINKLLELQREIGLDITKGLMQRNKVKK